MAGKRENDTVISKTTYSSYNPLHLSYHFKQNRDNIIKQTTSRFFSLMSLFCFRQHPFSRKKCNLNEHNEQITLVNAVWKDKDEPIFQVNFLYRITYYEDGICMTM